MVACLIHFDVKTHAYFKLFDVNFSTIQTLRQVINSLSEKSSLSLTSKIQNNFQLTYSFLNTVCGMYYWTLKSS